MSYGGISMPMPPEFEMTLPEDPKKNALAIIKKVSDKIHQKIQEGEAGVRLELYHALLIQWTGDDAFNDTEKLIVIRSLLLHPQEREIQNKLMTVVNITVIDSLIKELDKDDHYFHVAKSSELLIEAIDKSEKDFRLAVTRGEVTYTSLLEHFKFFISISYNYILGREHHSPIIVKESTQDGQKKLGDIWLGAMPQKKIAGLFNAAQHDQIEKDVVENNRSPLGLVISALQHFENYNVGFYSATTPEDWHNKQIKTLRLGIADYTAQFSKKLMSEAVQEIEKTRQEGKSVYIHCKAGRGRGPIILLCYLMTEYKDPQTNQPLDFEAAFKKTQEGRPFIDDFNKKKDKKDAVLEFVKWYKDNKPQSKPAPSAP